MINSLSRRFLSKEQDVMLLSRPIFIWGAPRSGTTLLYEFLAKHVEVGYPKDQSGKPREGTDFWWQAFGEHRGIADERLATPRRIQEIRKEYIKLLKQQKKSRLLDKIPFMTLWIPLVDKVFPNARHFHVIRDGRAVVHSILYKLRYSNKDKDGRFQRGELLYGPHPPQLVDPLSLPMAQRHARQWVLLVEHGQRNAELLGERCHELRYEELVNTPRVIMKDVLEHARLDGDEKSIAGAYPKRLENRNYKWTSTRYEDKSDGFTAHRAFEPEDMVYIESMKPMLQFLGYE